MERQQKIAVLAGSLLLLSGMLCNAWLLGIVSPLLKMLVLFFDLVLAVSGILLIWYREKVFKEITLLLGTLLCCFLVAEGAIRVLDPFPYVNSWERNHTEYGNLVRYDPLLGWSGIPSETCVFISENSRTFLRHNRQGFRDIEHNVPNTDPAIVFLGDSFTWGYEVGWDAMFVNRLRKKLPHNELFNLSMRGYGTDQEMIAFKRWPPLGPVKFVVVMFCENDFSDNAQFIKYGKFKPQFVMRDGQLVLTHVPVPPVDLWKTDGNVPSRRPSFHERLKGLVLQAQCLNELYFRLTHLKDPKEKTPAARDLEAENYEDQITRQILQSLAQEVAKKGAKLVVVAIPSKQQFSGQPGQVPYQDRLEKICKGLKDADYIDLAPDFKKTPFRTFYRLGIHLNEHGNKIVADSLYDYLKSHS